MEQTGKKITKVLIFLAYIYLNYISLRLNRKKRKIEKKKKNLTRLLHIKKLKMQHDRRWLKKAQQSREINEDFCNNNNDDWHSSLLFVRLSRT